jgi:hypothetical protein
VHILRRINNLFSFTFPGRRFQKTAYRLQDLPVRLNALNERRKKLQAEIITISHSSDACRECGGLCCRGQYNHFTAIDYIIREFSDNPIKQIGPLQKIEPLIVLFRNRIVYALRRNRRYVPKDVNTRCPDLGANGCSFDPENRPIRCVIWTCGLFLNSLSGHDLSRLAALTKELTEISLEAARIIDSR